MKTPLHTEIIVDLMDIIPLWSNYGQECPFFSNTQLFELKNKRKSSETLRFRSFLVEISGIEPLTS